jgi:type II secretory pathway component PulM
LRGFFVCPCSVAAAVSANATVVQAEGALPPRATEAAEAEAEAEAEVEAGQALTGAVTASARDIDMVVSCLVLSG